MNARFLSPLVVAAVVMLAGSSGTPALADNTAATYHQIALITVPGNPLTSFDISIVELSSQTDDEDDRSSNTDDRGDRSSKSDERSNQTYFLADRSNKAVDIFNASSNTFETRVAGFVGFTGNNDTSGPDGIVGVRDRHELWAGDGDSTVKVIDLRTDTIVASISTGGTARADELAYDQKDKLILIANDADAPPFASLIDTQTRAVVARIPLDDATNGVEQPVWDPQTHLFYMSIPQIGANAANGGVVVIDPKTRSRVGTFPVQNCQPAGLALGPKQHLLLGCSDPTAVQVMDARSGAIVATIAQVSGADEVWYNPGDNHYYVAARNNPTGPVLGIIDAKTDTWIQNVSTGPNAHSVAANPINNEIFVPLRGMGIGVYHR
jgi:DNA-binding beta-propeller fold protein YncE